MLKSMSEIYLNRQVMSREEYFKQKFCYISTAKDCAGATKIGCGNFVTGVREGGGGLSCWTTVGWESVSVAWSLGQMFYVSKPSI